VGLLSVGEEDAKGNTLVKEARDLLRAEKGINFIGNVEGRDLFRGVCDVMVCDGFVGNVVLKLIEGMAVSVVEALLKELATAQPTQAGAFKKAGKDLMNKYDYNEYGGAPLLGVAGISIICHGASTSRGIMNAVRVAKEFASHRVNERITELFSDGQRSIDA
jgi:glycerol-3-phosphate acyltransferase PlsX